MLLKWKVSLLVFISSLIMFSISVEILLRQQSDYLSDQQDLIQPVSGLLLFSDNAWLVVLTIALLLSIISYLISNRIVFVIDELIVGISKAGGGNYNHRINSKGSDEVGQLVISYNRMLDNMLSGSQEIKEQLENYTTILDNAVEGIISINDRGVIQTYNQSAENIFGFPVDDILGKNITKLVPEKTSTNIDHEIEQSFIADNLESNLPREVVGIRNNGQNFPIELSVSESTINNTLVFTGIIRDISERKESDLKQKKLETQLRKLQKQNSLESLSGGIAHDFNNILGPVLGYADMAIAESESGSKLHGYLSNILRSAHRARELINRIMNYSHQTENSSEHIHLTMVVEESIQLLKSSLPSDHKIETFLNTSNDMVLGETAQLTQVLVALVTNASQAIGDKAGTLSIRLDNIHPDEHILARSGHLTAGEYVCLRIEDTGEGMDTLTRAKIFEPFFSTRNKSDCSGLGLSVTYGIISSFGGDILVDSEPDKGCIFSIYLPSIEMDVSEDNKNEFNKSASDELILYVDDDRDVAKLGKEMLETLGYDVTISTKSEEALEIFRADPKDFDLVITDQSMPVLTGTQLARELKRIREDIPIILVSGFSASILSRELADSGIEHCIAKPIVINELAQIVSRALIPGSS
ncbi:MAG: response regulator [Gammaproteobacteria bacterium]|nr:response regulator [Gammaproteobacteria bacterium]